MKMFRLNRITTKFLCAALSFFMIISGGLCINANAADVDYSISMAELDPYAYVSGASEFSSELCNLVAQQMRSFSDKINIRSYKLTADEASDLYTQIILENPDIFYIAPNQMYYESDINGNVVSINPQYLYSKNEIPSKILEFEAAAEKLITDVQSGWNQEAKALIVHDNVALNCEYAVEEIYKGEDANPEIYTAYGCIVNHEAVCQGYALAYNYLLNKMGMEASVVVSLSMQHAWSLVKIDGRYYHVDVTWDDPTYDKLGQVYHTYFLQSDTAFMSDSSSRVHYDWKAEYTASDTTYDEYFWSDINTKIPYIGGNYYFICNIYGDSLKGNLVKCNGTESTALLDIGARWAANAEGTSVWRNNFAYLAVSGDKFYFNTTDKIYSVNFDGSDIQEIYSESDEQSEIGDIYGMTLKSDGYLYVSVSANPNSAAQSFQAVYVGINDIVIPTEPITKAPPTTEPPTTEPPTTEPPTTEPPTTEPPTTEAPTTEPPTTTPVVIFGDVNGDGEFNIKDAACVQLKLAKLYTSDFFEIAADVNGDGEINIKDAAYIQLRLAKLA